MSNILFRISPAPPAEKAGQVAKGGGILDFGFWIADFGFI